MRGTECLYIREPTANGLKRKCSPVHWSIHEICFTIFTTVYIEFYNFTFHLALGVWHTHLAHIENSPLGPSWQIKSNTPLYGSLQLLSKITRKIITYRITGDVGNVVLLHPHISGIFLGNVHLHALIHLLK